jgi:hypothetical protein
MLTMMHEARSWLSCTRLYRVTVPGSRGICVVAGLEDLSRRCSSRSALSVNKAIVERPVTACASRSSILQPRYFMNSEDVEPTCLEANRGIVPQCIHVDALDFD